MKNKILNLATLIVIGLSVTHCGSSQDPTIPPPTGVYPGQPFPGYPGVPISPSSFETDCLRNLGLAQDLYNGGKRCLINLALNENLNAYYRMTADSAYAGGYDLGIDLRPGDKLSWNGSACWNDGGFSWSWNWSWGGNTGGSCGAVDQSGYDHKQNTTLSYGGFPEGVLGYNGQNFFFLGSSYTTTVSQPGHLRIGINGPNMAGGYLYGNLSVTRCIDANGNAISCPF